MTQGSRSPRGTVVSLDGRQYEDRRAAKQVVNLTQEAKQALDAVLEGDVDQIHTAAMLCMRAVMVTMRHGFATGWNWRQPA